ncbi:hypothetical protein J6590_003847 [Homalodisca vitripennis]|nr:hypothetical protein J6590_003847 [Homalodisca vitripennis]
MQKPTKSSFIDTQEPSSALISTGGVGGVGVVGELCCGGQPQPEPHLDPSTSADRHQSARQQALNDYRLPATTHLSAIVARVRSNYRPQELNSQRHDPIKGGSRTINQSRPECTAQFPSQGEISSSHRSEVLDGSVLVLESLGSLYTIAFLLQLTSKSIEIDSAEILVIVFSTYKRLAGPTASRAAAEGLKPAPGLCLPRLIKMLSRTDVDDAASIPLVHGSRSRTYASSTARRIQIN